MRGGCCRICLGGGLLEGAEVGWGGGQRTGGEVDFAEESGSGAVSLMALAGVGGSWRGYLASWCLSLRTMAALMMGWARFLNCRRVL